MDGLQKAAKDAPKVCAVEFAGIEDWSSRDARKGIASFVAVVEGNDHATGEMALGTQRNPPAVFARLLRMER